MGPALALFKNAFAFLSCNSNYFGYKRNIVGRKPPGGIRPDGAFSRTPAIALFRNRFRFDVVTGGLFYFSRIKTIID